MVFNFEESWSVFFAFFYITGLTIIIIVNHIIFLYFRGLASGWIGLDDRKTEGTYTWSDRKEKSMFTNWGVGEPNAMKDDADCVEMIAGEKYGLEYDGTWNDEVCDKTFNFICQIHGVVLGKEKIFL